VVIVIVALVVHIIMNVVIMTMISQRITSPRCSELHGMEPLLVWANPIVGASQIHPTATLVDGRCCQYLLQRMHFIAIITCT
jgi:hypothetical protein